MATYTPRISALSSLLGRWAGGEGTESREAWAREAEERLELEADGEEEEGPGEEGCEEGSGEEDEDVGHHSADENTLFPSSPVSISRHDGISAPSSSTNQAAHSPPVNTGPLPEDDGNAALRRRLLALASSVTDEKERARQMHALMTERYRTSALSPLSSSLPAAAPTAVLSTTPTGRSYLATPPPSPHSPPSTITPKSWTPAYIRPKLRPPQPTLSIPDRAVTYIPNSSRTLGCKHYTRKNKMQCATCQKWYTCRLCHDAVEDHTLPRQQTANMLCMPCSTVQPVAQDCAYCTERMATYYCNKCKLWDSRKKNYHCDDCGICRIGEGLGKDFYHCNRCGTCLDIKLKGNHRCIERSTECDCPICGEYLFASREKVVFTTCGHSIHQSCLDKHKRVSYKCPTCARTIANMTVAFRALTLEIERTPLPQPYDTWRSVVSCNDCACKCVVPFHFLGQMCKECGSYNTILHKVRRDGGEDEGNEVEAALERARQAVAEVRAEAMARGVIYDDGWGNEGEEKNESEEEEGAEGSDEEGEEDEDSDDGGLWNWGLSPRGSGDELEDEEEDDDDEEEEDPFFLIGHI